MFMRTPSMLQQTNGLGSKPLKASMPRRNTPCLLHCAMQAMHAAASKTMSNDGSRLPPELAPCSGLRLSKTSVCCLEGLCSADSGGPGTRTGRLNVDDQ